MEREFVLLLGYMDNIALAKCQAGSDEKRCNHEDYVWLSDVHNDLTLVATALEQRQAELAATACGRLIDKYRWYLVREDAYGLRGAMERWWKYVNLEDVLDLLLEIHGKSEEMEGLEV